MEVRRDCVTCMSANSDCHCTSETYKQRMLSLIQEMESFSCLASIDGNCVANWPVSTWITGPLGQRIPSSRCCEPLSFGGKARGFNSLRIQLHNFLAERSPWKASVFSRLSFPHPIATITQNDGVRGEIQSKQLCSSQAFGRQTLFPSILGTNRDIPLTDFDFDDLLLFRSPEDFVSGGFERYSPSPEVEFQITNDMNIDSIRLPDQELGHVTLDSLIMSYEEVWSPGTFESEGSSSPNPSLEVQSNHLRVRKQSPSLRNQTSSTRRYHCKACGMRFFRMSHLGSHALAIHLKVKLFRCDTCGKELSNKSNLSRHKKTVHRPI
mmetsp:Transcript_9902/g.20139  ORF Transcript_9902/g.20139 Transcript_9902/m.20139 type:complete len:323 (+) Transcript_9902:602-1570(+)